jgi:uncharacterized protein (DUF362 family)
MTQVTIIRCQSYDSVKEKIKEALKLHTEISFRKNEKVLLKPNLLSLPKNETEPVTTDPRFILALAEILLGFGVKLAIGDSPAFGTTDKILGRLGIKNKLIAMAVKIENFTNPIKRFQAHSYDRNLYAYDKIINVPKLKVHSQFFFTGSIKNLFGFVVAKRKALLHLKLGDRQNHFAQMLVQNYLDVKPYFTIMDAVDAMNKKGPRKGEIKNVGLIVCGQDCVAIDSLLTEMLGLSLEDNKILQAARNMNAGVWDIRKIHHRGLKKLPQIQLDFPRQIPISFSLSHVVKSVFANFLIKLNLKKNKA